MFTRFTTAVALVAAAKAEWLSLKTLGYGDSTNVAGQCQGEFLASDGTTSEGTFFVGIADVAGETGGQWLVGWGKDLCTADKADAQDWATDYTISLTDSDGTVYATGLGLSCPKLQSNDKQLVDGLKKQIGDKKAEKALGDLKNIVYDGQVIYVDAVISSQGDLSSEVGALSSDLKTDGTTAVNDIVSSTDALIEAIKTEITVTKRPDYDSAASETATALGDATTTLCSAKLDSENWTTNKDAAEAAIDEVSAQFTSEFESIFDSFSTEVDTLTTTSKQDVIDIGTSLLEKFDTNVADIDALLSGDFLDQKKVEKDVVRKGKKAQISLDASLAKIQKGTAKVGLNFKKAVKTSINAAIPDAETAVADTVTAATNTVDGLFTGDKKLKACTKSLVKTQKSVKKIAKKEGAKLAKYAGVVAKDMNTSIKTAVKDQKKLGKETSKAFETSAKGLYTELKAFFPVIEAANFDYSALVAAGKTLTVSVTRALDDKTQTCTVGAATVNTELETAGITDCKYTQFDEMFFDYLCTMTPLKVAGTELDCSIAINRPSSVCLGSWKSIEKAINDATKLADQAVKDAEAAIADATGVVTDVTTDVTDVVNDLTDALADITNALT